MKYIISGKPIPLARHRYGKGIMYNCQTMVQGRTRLDLMKQHNKQPLLDGPLHLEIDFHMQMPNYWSQRKKDLMAGKPHEVKADLTNLLKFTEDCANKVIFHDDSQISSITARKFYAWFPKTEFTLTQVER